MTNAEARCNKSLRPRKPEGLLGRTAQDVHLDSHTAPELCHEKMLHDLYILGGTGNKTEGKFEEKQNSRSLCLAMSTTKNQ